jgi:hypothetical protein
MLIAVGVKPSRLRPPDPQRIGWAERAMPIMTQLARVMGFPGFLPGSAHPTIQS